MLNPFQLLLRHYPFSCILILHLFLLYFLVYDWCSEALARRCVYLSAIELKSRTLRHSCFFSMLLSTWVVVPKSHIKSWALISQLAMEFASLDSISRYFHYLEMTWICDAKWTFFFGKVENFFFILKTLSLARSQSVSRRVLIMEGWLMLKEFHFMLKAGKQPVLSCARAKTFWQIVRRKVICVCDDMMKQKRLKRCREAIKPARDNCCAINLFSQRERIWNLLSGWNWFSSS